MRRQAVFDRAAVLIQRARLDVNAILLQPDIQPLTDGHFRRLHVGALGDGRQCFLEFLRDFLLRLAVDAAADLLAGAGIASEGIFALPASVSAFINASSALRASGGLSGHHNHHPSIVFLVTNLKAV